jgi:hypothetical protein
MAADDMAVLAASMTPRVCRKRVRHPRHPAARRRALPAPLHRPRGAARQGRARDGARRGHLPVGFGRAQADRRHVGPVVRERRLRPHSISEAVYRQMETLPFYNSFFNTTNVPAVQLAAKLVELAPPQFNHVFFTGSGSEATTPSCAWCGATGSSWGSRSARSSSAATTPTTAAPWPAPRWAAWPACMRRAGCRFPASCTSASRTTAESARGMSEKTNSASWRPAGWREDPGARRRQGRRLHRRTGAGRGRRDHPAADLLAGDPAHLRQVRHPAGRRRSHLRLRAAGHLVRARS